MLEVKSLVTIYEIDGEETHGLKLPTITVRNHWNEKGKIVLEVDSKQITVVALDLQDAIDNATNVGSR
jgi:hypothetical protein